MCPDFLLKTLETKNKLNREDHALFAVYSEDGAHAFVLTPATPKKGGLIQLYLLSGQEKVCFLSESTETRNFHMGNILAVSKIMDLFEGILERHRADLEPILFMSCKQLRLPNSNRKCIKILLKLRRHFNLSFFAFIFSAYIVHSSIILLTDEVSLDQLFISLVQQLVF